MWCMWSQESLSITTSESHYMCTDYSCFKYSLVLLRRRAGTAVADEYYKLLLWCEHHNSSSSVAAEVIFMKHVNNGSVSRPITHCTVTWLTRALLSLMPLLLQPTTTRKSTQDVSLSEIQRYVRQKTGVDFKLDTLPCTLTPVVPKALHDLLVKVMHVTYIKKCWLT